MTSEQVFKSAKWIQASKNCESPLFRGYFYAKNVKSAKITICGLGFFTLFINGQSASNDKFVPAWTDYEKFDWQEREYKITDEFRHRIYCMEYDITPFICNGENLIALTLGGAWYAKWYKGTPKLCYRIEMSDDNGVTTEVFSNENVKWHPSYITRSEILKGETHDYNIISDKWYAAGFDDSAFINSCEAAVPDSTFDIQTCPPDKTIRKVKPVIVEKFENYTIYDVGENISGFPVIKTNAAKGSEIEILYSEELLDGQLSFDSSNCWGGKQSDSFITDGTESREFKCVFMWHGFRYFSVTNNAKPVCVEITHSDVNVTSTFDSDNEILNWLYDAYIRTQLSNMHAGIPSDCPHREGRGYTGDGQLSCECGMLLFDSKEFYLKWMEDIYDCQDLTTGHVQYTAPFVTSGGGPGGWGCAIAVVPYIYYKQYGDISVLEKFYPRMKLYFNYLESHSQNGLVVSDEPWAWCLGDWCTPDKIKIPEPFVNNYFYIKALEIYIECSKLLNKNENIATARAETENRKSAIMKTYFDEKTGDFCENIQGANAFALDISIGNEKTLENMLSHYNKTKMYDTGIFGTDIVTRILFEKGYSQLAYDLLSSKGETSFHSQMQQGATTLWEYWDGKKSRSHPMFGAVVKYLYFYLLGIRQKDGSTAYSDIIIEPQIVDGLNRCGGSIETANGEISVEYEIVDKKIIFRVDIGDIQAEFRYKGQSYSINKGYNKFETEK